MYRQNGAFQCICNFTPAKCTAISWSALRRKCNMIKFSIEVWFRGRGNYVEQAPCWRITFNCEECRLLGCTQYRYFVSFGKNIVSIFTCWRGFIALGFLVLWEWRRYFPPKRRLTEYLHGATSQKMAFFRVTAVKTSNLATFISNFVFRGNYTSDKILLKDIFMSMPIKELHGRICGLQCLGILYKLYTRINCTWSTLSTQKHTKKTQATSFWMVIAN
jgi:hypothetical protein